MTETPDGLRETLAELHRELEAAGAVSPELQEPLRQVMRDIEAALERSEPQRATSLIERVSDMALDFETEHPTIAGVLNRLTHLLSSMGI